MSLSQAREAFDVAGTRGHPDELSTRRQAPLQLARIKMLAAAGAVLAIVLILIYALASSGSKPAPPYAAPTGAPQPQPPRHLADVLNLQYKGFDVSDDTSPLGVTIWMRNDWTVYCNKGCFEGHADCRISASIINHKVMIQERGDKVAVNITMRRRAGALFNQTAVDGWLTKCSYLWDGTSDRRYNTGCGGTSDTIDCDSPYSAYGNVCRSTEPEHPCTVTDQEVLRDWHVTRGIENCPHRTIDDPCYWKGPAFEEPKWDTEHKRWLTVSSDETREMLKVRVEREQEPWDHDRHDPKEYHNELILDGRVLLKDLHRDALSIVPAFVYVKDDDDAATEIGKKMATEMRDTFREEYAVMATPPLIQIDITCNIAEPDCPFRLG